MRKRTRPGCVLAVAFAVIALAACGSSKSSSAAHSTSSAASAGTTHSSTPATTTQASSTPTSATTTTTASSSAVAAAEANYARYRQLPASLNIPPVGKPIPSGKHVVFISCPVASCEIGYEGVQQAIKPIGWTAQKVDYGNTPETFISAWQQALNFHPNVIVCFASFPLTVVQSELAQAKQQGVIVLTAGASGYPVGGASPVTANVNGPVTFNTLGHIYADVAIQAAGGPPKIALAIDPTIPVWGPIIQGFKDGIQSAGGQFNQLTMKLGDIGNALPGEIVTYLQAHPGTQYLLLTLDAMITGLPQAMKAAGITNVKLITGTTDTPDIPLLQDGTEFASVTVEQYQAMWRLIDCGIRKMVGVSTTFCQQPAGSFLIINKSNLALTKNIRAFPDANSQFLKAWGK